MSGRISFDRYGAPGNTMEKPKLEGFLHVSDTRVKHEATLPIVGRVVRFDCSGEILEAYLGKLIIDRKHFDFLVQMIDGGHLQKTGGYAGGKVLDSLHFLDR